jgi:hypothetical protein
MAVEPSIPFVTLGADFGQPSLSPPRLPREVHSGEVKSLDDPYQSGPFSEAFVATAIVEVPSVPPKPGFLSWAVTLWRVRVWLRSGLAALIAAPPGARGPRGISELAQDVAANLQEGMSRWWERQSPLSIVRLALLLMLIGALNVLFRVQEPAALGRSLLVVETELAALQRDFDRREAEAAMKAQVGGLGRVPFFFETSVRQRSRRPTAVSQTVWVDPLSVVSLERLGQIDAHTQADAAVAVYALDTKALASSLSWRLSRIAAIENGSTPSLEKIALFWGAVGEQDVELEQQVVELRRQSVEAQRALASAQRAESRKQAVLGQEAAALANELSTASAAADARYQEAARRVESRRDIAPMASAPSEGKVAVARVTVAYDAQRASFDVPVRLDVLSVPVTPLAGVRLEATRAAASWDLLANQSPEAAAATVASRIPWYVRPRSVLGLEVRGIDLLKALSCILFALVSVVSWSLLPAATRRQWSAKAAGLAARLRAEKPSSGS